MLKKINVCFIGVFALSYFAPVYIMQSWLKFFIDYSENLRLYINPFLGSPFLAIYS